MSFDLIASKEFTTISELAATWCVSVPHIHNLIRQSKLPAYRIGHRLIIRRDEAKRFLESNKTIAAKAAA